MTAPTRKHRRHPLAALVVWLALGLAACLLALNLVLTITAAATPVDVQLDSAYTQGMAQGYQLCRNDRGAAQ